MVDKRLIEDVLYDYLACLQRVGTEADQDRVIQAVEELKKCECREGVCEKNK